MRPELSRVNPSLDQFRYGAHSQLLERRVLRAGAGTDAQVGAQPHDAVHRRVVDDQSRPTTQCTTQLVARRGAGLRICQEPSDQLLLLDPKCGKCELSLAREVEVERAFAHPTGQDQIVEGDAIEAALGKRPCCGVDDERSGSLGALLTDPRVACRHHPY